jgi:hypothetical protein
MRHLSGLPALIIAVLLEGGAAAAPPVVVIPAEIVLERELTIELLVKNLNLPGAGKVRAAVNVGEVKGVWARGNEVRLDYRSPRRPFAHRLVVLLWREGTGQPGVVVRIPLLAHTEFPVKTRAHSAVTIEIAGRAYGPMSSGWKGEATVRALVPPGVTEGWAEVTDPEGLRNREKFPIRAEPYNLLALAVDSTSGRHHVLLAASEDPPATPLVEVQHILGGGGQRLRLRQIGGGYWAATWRPPADAKPGRWIIRSWVPGSVLSEARAEVTLAAPGLAKSPSPRGDHGLGWNLSLAAGLVDNTKALLSARFTLEGGADYPLGRGRIGARLLASVAWADQDVQVTPELPPVSSSVVMVPLGALVTYRLSFGPWSPYLAAGPLLQLVQVSSEGEHTGTRRSLSTAFGFLGLLGARARIGPGGVFLQAGYQHSSVDTRDTELYAGGIVLELGYRLEL